MKMISQKRIKYLIHYALTNVSTFLSNPLLDIIMQETPHEWIDNTLSFYEPINELEYE
jgi:hypothetical protein